MRDATATEVAATIRAEMARRSLRQHQLATTLGLSQAAISRRLRGDTPFDVTELGKVAAWLDIPMSRLLPAQRKPNGGTAA